MSNRWLMGTLIAGVIGLAIYLGVVDKRKPPQPDTARGVAVQEPSPVPAAQPMNALVDVLDIDPLLDPPAIPFSEPITDGVVQIAFEDDKPVPPPPATPAPAFIPPAIE